MSSNGMRKGGVGGAGAKEVKTPPSDDRPSPENPAFNAPYERVPGDPPLQCLINPSPEKQVRETHADLGRVCCRGRCIKVPVSVLANQRTWLKIALRKGAQVLVVQRFLRPSHVSVRFFIDSSGICENGRRLGILHVCPFVMIERSTLLSKLF